MPKKRMSPLLRVLCVVLGLLAAEAIVPLAITYPFLSHEGATLMKARTQYLDEDQARATAVFKAHEQAKSRPDTSTDEYRLALIQGAKSVQTDMGALAISTNLIQYLAAHPEDKELQELSLTMVDRGMAYQKNTFTPIYERLDRIYVIRDASFPLWFYRKELQDVSTRARTTVPQLLNKTRNGILHPKAYLDARQKEIDETLKLMHAPSASSAKKP